jgi:DNA-binding MarR family transcriptional regulator
MSVNELYSLLQETHLLIEDGDRRVMRGFGLTPTLLTLLTELEPTQGKRLVDLTNTVLIDASTLTRMIDRLVEAALVERTIDPGDRRAQRVFLTPTGDVLRAQALAARDAMLARRLSVLDDTEQTDLGELLQKLSAGLRATLTQDKHG